MKKIENTNDKKEDKKTQEDRSSERTRKRQHRVSSFLRLTPFALKSTTPLLKEKKKELKKWDKETKKISLS